MGSISVPSAPALPWRLSNFENAGTFARIEQTITSEWSICVLLGIDFACVTGAPNELIVSASTERGGLLYANQEGTGLGDIWFGWRGALPLYNGELFVAFAATSIACSVGVSAWGEFRPGGPLTYTP